MRDIYLIDFENVASEGLSGITYLSEEDKVIIFYSNNSNRLTMKMHILIGKSVCQLEYFEVTVGGKNALDHQIATWLGYLIGTGAAERNYYIVSRDMGYKHVANFWAAKRLGPKVRCIDAIKGAGRLERNRKAEPVLEAVPAVKEAETPAAFANEALVSLPEEVTVCALEAAPAAEMAEPVELTVEAPAEVAEQAKITEQPQVLEQTEVPEHVEALEPMSEQVPEPEEAETLPMAVPEAEAVETLPVEVAVVPDVPEIRTEEAPEPQMTELPVQMPKRTYRSRTRVRKNRSRTYTQQRDVAPETPEPVVENQPAPADAPAQTEAASEVKKPDSGKKQNPKGRVAKSKTGKKEGEKPAGNLEQLSSLIAPYPKLQESVLRDLIANNKRQVLCNTLRKHLGQEKGLALYNEIKRVAWH